MKVISNGRISSSSSAASNLSNIKAAAAPKFKLTHSLFSEISYISSIASWVAASTSPSHKGTTCVSPPGRGGTLGSSASCLGWVLDLHSLLL